MGGRSRQDRHSAGAAGLLTGPPPGEGTDPDAWPAALARRPPEQPTLSRRAGRRRPGGCSRARTARGTGRRVPGTTGTARPGSGRLVPPVVPFFVGGEQSEEVLRVPALRDQVG